MTSPGVARPADSRRRYLLLVGAGDYRRAQRLDHSAEEMDRIERLLRPFGYETAVRLLDEEAGEIRKQVRGFFSDAARRPDDLAVVYVTGHGIRDPSGRHFLLPSRGDEAIPTVELPEWFFGDSVEAPQSVWLILDVCFAGAGAKEIVAAVQDYRDSALRHVDRGLIVFSAVSATAEAKPLRLIRAMEDALSTIRWPAPSQAHIHPMSLSNFISEAIGGDRFGSDAVSLGGARWLPNPVHDPDWNPENLEHWETRALGRMHPSEAPDFFTGREPAIGDLLAWFRRAEKRGRLALVTGDPGSGKSALVARVLRLLRQEEGVKGAAGEGGEPRRLLARGLTPAEAWERVARLYDCRSHQGAEVLRELAERRRGVALFVDQLDEAKEPESVARRVVAALAALPGARICVGTRRTLLDDLGERDLLVDLDTPAYSAAADLESYAATVLARLEGSVYRDRPAVSAAVARAIAARSGNSFLCAAVMSRALARRAAPIDTSAAGWEAGLPNGLGGAFDEEVARDPARERALRDLLLPLAFSEGRGLPQEDLWAAVASRISGQRYRDSDIEDLIRRLGFYITPDVEGETAVYRIYHDELARHLRESCGRPAREIHRAICSALDESIGGPEPERRRWRLAGDYLRRYLPLHASFGGCLGSWAEDPGLPTHVDPSSLLVALRRDAATRSLPLSEALARCAYAVRHLDRPEDRACLLALSAFESEGAHLAATLLTSQPRRVWEPVWVHPLPGLPGLVLTRCARPASGLWAGWQAGGITVLCKELLGPIRVLDPENLTERVLLEDPDSRADQIRLVRNARRRLIGVPWRQEYRIVDADAGSHYSLPRFRPMESTAIDILDTLGELLVMRGGQDGSLTMWRVARQEVTALPTLGAPVWDVRIAEHDRRRIVIAADSKGVHAFDEGGSAPRWSWIDPRSRGARLAVGCFGEVPAVLCTFARWMAVLSLESGKPLVDPTPISIGSASDAISHGRGFCLANAGGPLELIAMTLAPDGVSVSSIGPWDSWPRSSRFVSTPVGLRRSRGIPRGSRPRSVRLVSTRAGIRIVTCHADHSVRIWKDALDSAEAPSLGTSPAREAPLPDCVGLFALGNEPDESLAALTISDDGPSPDLVVRVSSSTGDFLGREAVPDEFHGSDRGAADARYVVTPTRDGRAVMAGPCESFSGALAVQLGSEESRAGSPHPLPGGCSAVALRGGNLLGVLKMDRKAFGVDVVDLETGVGLVCLSTPKPVWRAAAIEWSRNLLAALHQMGDSAIELWNLDSGLLVSKVELGSDLDHDIVRLFASRDGLLLVACRGGARVWFLSGVDLVASREYRVPYDGAISDVCVLGTDRGPMLILSGTHGIVVWDILRKRTSARIPLGECRVCAGRKPGVFYAWSGGGLKAIRLL